jgi:hypothetical protein
MNSIVDNKTDKLVKEYFEKIFTGSFAPIKFIKSS